MFKAAYPAALLAQEIVGVGYFQIRLQNKEENLEDRITLCEKNTFNAKLKT